MLNGDKKVAEPQLVGRRPEPPPGGPEPKARRPTHEGPKAQRNRAQERRPKADGRRGGGYIYMGMGRGSEINKVLI